jgi:hypothetical protein
MESEDMEQGGFAGTGGAHDRQEIAVVNFQVDVSQCVERASLEWKDAVDVVESNHEKNKKSGGDNREGTLINANPDE